MNLTIERTIETQATVDVELSDFLEQLRHHPVTNPDDAAHIVSSAWSIIVEVANQKPNFTQIQRTVISKQLAELAERFK
jgi:hypothetical protein